MELEDDRVFFHYTSVESCFSIVKNRTLRLTDYRFLNDRLELESGISRFIERCSKEDGDAIKTALIWHADYYFHCVFSLSKSPETLSQWRAYADDGKGVAIGFSSYFLNRVGLMPLDCEYLDQDAYISQVIERHQETISKTRSALKRLVAINSFWEWVDENKALFDSLVNDLLRLKNPAFEEEKEVRAIISLDRKDISYRPSMGLLIPYHEISFWNDEVDGGDQFAGLAVKEIWLGPKCDRRNETSFEAFAPKHTRINRYDCGYV